MGVNRTIYTQGAVNICSGASGFFPNTMTGNGFFLSGVQSANFSCNSPKVDVNAFGSYGTINKVQVEPQVATLEISLVINSGNNSDGSGYLSGLVTDALRPTPSGVTVTASGVGQVKKAILTSFRLEGAVGALPTLGLTFEGISGDPAANIVNPANQTIQTQTVPISTTDSWTNIQCFWSGTDTVTGCPQSVRATWEMPMERVNCLGNDINSPTIFSRFPGSLSFTAEGMDDNMFNVFLTGVQIGNYKVCGSSAAIRETSRTANMAVGETAATFNITSEGVALGAAVSGC